MLNEIFKGMDNAAEKINETESDISKLIKYKNSLIELSTNK